ncbi:hypothetical protein Tco_0513860 [Tanacetum coccineum]
MVPATTSLTGFSGETIWPLGQLRLLVTIGDADHSTKSMMNCHDREVIVAKTNVIIGRPKNTRNPSSYHYGHGMLKFPANGGIVTICSTILIPAECTTLITSSKEVPKEVEVRPKNFKIALHPNFPDQEVAMELNIDSISEKVFACSTEEKGAVPTEPCKRRIQSGVMVKKHDGSWRMCVDFTDLNKACPQDCYPLPEIDWKVESLCGYPFK